MRDLLSRLLYLEGKVAVSERSAKGEAQKPTYKDYVKRKRKERKKPLSEEEWTAKVLGLPTEKPSKPKPEPRGKIDYRQSVTMLLGKMVGKEKLPEHSSQTIRTEKELFEQAEEAHQQQVDALDEGKGVDKAIGARVVRMDKGDKFDLGEDEPVVVIGPQKRADRSRVKVQNKYGGDWGKLKDIVRGSVAVSLFQNLPKVLEAIGESGLELAEAPEDKFSNPTDAGYRDLSLAIRYSNGHIGELQIHVKPMLEAKEKGHALYERVRQIEEQAKKDGRRDLSEEEQAIVDDANAKMKAMYDAAWEKAQRQKAEEGSKAATEMKMAVPVRPKHPAKFYSFDGVPAKWGRLEFPILVRGNGDEEPFHDIETFYREALPIPKAQFERLLRKQQKTSSRLLSLEGRVRTAEKHKGLWGQFMQQWGGKKVVNPDTGNRVMLKSLKGDKGKKLLQREFEDWKRQMETHRKRIERGED